LDVGQVYPVLLLLLVLAAVFWVLGSIGCSTYNATY